jgi:4-hydroxyproline epimerase
MPLRKIHVIDSHTGGEPTRVVASGGPNLARAPVSDQLREFRESHDQFRSAIVNEPRGSDAIVGALLCEPADPSCSAGVIFFNNVGYLGMCGHGSIGLMVTLAYLGRAQAGAHRIETPVGIVTLNLDETGQVTVANVPSYRHAKDVTIDVAPYGPVTGDIAWGGNWFFLVRQSHVPIEFRLIEELTEYTWKIRQALERNSIAGAGGQQIDHIELFAPVADGTADSRNFVLCPGKEYDRSPCGTGTSAKLACLYADGKLREGETWRQQSIVGSVFEGRVQVHNGSVVPVIKGSAHITADAFLILDDNDPFCWGIR